MKQETIAVHRGNYRDKATGGVSTPVFTSSAYDYRGSSTTPYPRYFNTPNQDVVARKICGLEKGDDALVFASGMAAMSTSILAHAGQSDHVVLMDALYGGTHALATDWLNHFGINYTFAGTSAEEVISSVVDATRVIVIETPTNPLLSIIDIRQVAEFAGEKGIITIIDNTFASPVNQNPIALGIDIVVHSGTKYLGGHSDICCGMAVASKKILAPVRELARCIGGSLDAQSCYLLERSMKTLVLRVERQTENALNVARFLDSHPGVARVYYPGLVGSKGHEIASRQMKGFGGMLSFELAGGDASGFVDALTMISPAVSLGGVESTICIPALTSHSVMSAEERARVGVSDSLLRLSVGVEHADDINADLDRALGSH